VPAGASGHEPSWATREMSNSHGMIRSQRHVEQNTGRDRGTMIFEILGKSLAPAQAGEGINCV